MAHYGLLLAVLYLIPMFHGLENPPQGIKKSEVADNRQAKFINSFKFIKFANEECEGDDDRRGTCYNEKECVAMGGEEAGSCADDFGVCCILSFTCDGTISRNNTHFLNPNHPEPYDDDGKCEVHLIPPKGALQIQLLFARFVIVGPVDGDCDNDTFTVIREGRGSTIPVLCGFNTGQHIYIDLDDDDEEIKLIFHLSSISFDRLWDIKISFLSIYDSLRAPPRCLQYKNSLTGEISSFNYVDSDDDSPQLLNDQTYSICFAPISGYCDIAILFEILDIGTMGYCICDNDYVGINNSRTCGVARDLTVIAIASGPIIITVKSDGDNRWQHLGFKAEYMYINC